MGVGVCFFWGLGLVLKLNLVEGNKKYIFKLFFINSGLKWGVIIDVFKFLWM